MNKKNELMNVNFDDLSGDELEVIQTKLINARFTKIEETQKKMMETLSIVEQERKIDNQRINEEIEKTKGMAESSLRATSVRYGWVNQGDFGRFFEQSIGSKTLGKLLRIVGLAMKNKSITTPYRQYIPKYATTSVQRNKAGYDYTKVEWNFELCMDFINDWLRENGYYESFYSAKNTKEMEKFINQLDNK